MDNSTANLTTPEASTNSTANSFLLLESLKICMFSIDFLFGLPTHSYVIWLIVTRKESVVASEFINLNLSVCENGNALNSLFYIISVCVPCVSKLPLFLLGLFFTGRPVFQCLMCVERYLAVVHPVTFLRFKPLRYKVNCCAVAWIIILSSCFSCLFVDFQNNGQIHAQFFSLQFLLALLIQLFCLVAVLRALKQSGPGERKREKEENRMKRRAFHLILIITVGMTTIYLPFALTGLYTILRKQYIHALWITGLVCYVLAGYVQPVLYLHRTGKLSWVPLYIKWLRYKCTK